MIKTDRGILQEQTTLAPDYFKKHVTLRVGSSGVHQCHGNNKIGNLPANLQNTGRHVIFPNSNLFTFSSLKILFLSPHTASHLTPILILKILSVET